MNPRFVRKKSL